MADNISINKVKTGMILTNHKGKRYVVIDTLLNGDDDYYSCLDIISEEEYLDNKGKEISKKELKTFETIEMTEYHKNYKNCDDCCNVSSKIIYRFE